MEEFQENFDKSIEEYARNNQYDVSMIPAHAHTGSDSLRVDFSNVANRTRFVLYRVLSPDSSTAVLSGIGGDFVIPFSGFINSVGATVDTAGTTGATTIDVNKNGATVLFTKITIDSGSKTSRNAATQPMVEGSKKTFETGDIFTFDIDAVSGTPAKGLTVFLNVTQQ